MRRRVPFPDPRSAGEDGLLCVGGDLSVETLVAAYSLGVFPWPQEGLPLLWFSPFERGVLDFTDLHWPRRFLRVVRSGGFEVTFNRAFADVVRECAKVPRSHEKGTWILPEMQTAYLDFHRAGYAHSVEAWREGRLVGGLYGVYVGGVFSGESMFYHESDASKICLHALVTALSSAGVTWIDTQMVTPILETFGGKYISRDEYLDRVAEAEPRDLGELFGTKNR
jgi:leucyl/phenylalanyl-tRNA--protein transferase